MLIQQLECFLLKWIRKQTNENPITNSFSDLVTIILTAIEKMVVNTSDVVDFRRHCNELCHAKIIRRKIPLTSPLLTNGLSEAKLLDRYRCLLAHLFSNLFNLYIYLILDNSTFFFSGIIDCVNFTRLKKTSQFKTSRKKLDKTTNNKKSKIKIKT